MTGPLPQISHGVSVGLPPTIGLFRLGFVENAPVQINGINCRTGFQTI